MCTIILLPFIILTIFLPLWYGLIVSSIHLRHAVGASAYRVQIPLGRRLLSNRVHIPGQVGVGSGKHLPLPRSMLSLSVVMQ